MQITTTSISPPGKPRIVQEIQTVIGQDQKIQLEREKQILMIQIDDRHPDDTETDDADMLII
jgi:hypothetical protein